MNKKRVLLVNYGGSPMDRTVWSGIPFSIYNELIKYYDVDVLVVNKTSNVFAKTYRKIRTIFSKKDYLDNHSISTAKKTSKTVERYISNNHFDIIFSIGASQIAYLKTNIPIVYYCDAVVSQMVNYYWFNVNNKNLIEANKVQQLALSNATKCAFASSWAMNEAINRYNISSEKCSVIHFGSNIEVKSIKKDKHNNINLLFVGKGWDRKGGDIAVSCVKRLNKIDNNNKYVLHLVGSQPPYEIMDDYIKVYGFINRNDDNQKRLLDSLREQADIFILPTRAECAGIVFGEACAYSIPILTFDTGGIKDYVINDYNGYRISLDVEDPGDSFAVKIIEILNNKNKLKSLSKNAREYYKSTLNWNSCGLKFKDIIDNISK